MCDKLQFFQSVENVDIWFDQDTKDGKTKYTFWFQGKTYERDTQEAIIALARSLYNDWFKRTNGRKR